MMNIESDGKDVFVIGISYINIMGKEYRMEHERLDESEQREMLSWFKKNKPEMWNEIEYGDL